MRTALPDIDSVLDHGYVFVSMFVRKTTGDVQVAMHWVPPTACRMLARLPPSARALAHGAICCKLRPLLLALDLLRELQRMAEASRDRVARTMCPVAGRAGARQPNKVLDPVVLHDACTLYMGCAGLLLGAGESWMALPEPCACGHNEWSISATPPRVSKGRVVRDALPECVAWCWMCLARRQVDEARVLRGFGVRA